MLQMKTKTKYLAQGQHTVGKRHRQDVKSDFTTVTAQALSLLYIASGGNMKFER